MLFFYWIKNTFFPVYEEWKKIFYWKNIFFTGRLNCRHIKLDYPGSDCSRYAKFSWPEYVCFPAEHFGDKMLWNEVIRQKKLLPQPQMMMTSTLSQKYEFWALQQLFIPEANHIKEILSLKGKNEFLKLVHYYNLDYIIGYDLTDIVYSRT